MQQKNKKGRLIVSPNGVDA